MIMLVTFPETTREVRVVSVVCEQITVGMTVVLGGYAERIVSVQLDPNPKRQYRMVRTETGRSIELWNGGWTYQVLI